VASTGLHILVSSRSVAGQVVALVRQPCNTAASVARGLDLTGS
jgi:hypothetical protein